MALLVPLGSLAIIIIAFVIRAIGDVGPQGDKQSPKVTAAIPAEKRNQAQPPVAKSNSPGNAKARAAARLPEDPPSVPLLAFPPRHAVENEPPNRMGRPPQDAPRGEGVLNEPAAPPREVPREPPAVAAAEAPKPLDEVEVFKGLREAKHKFRATVAADLPKFIAECQDVVKREATATGDLDLAKDLLKEIESLKTDGKTPTRKQFEVPRKRHLEVRKKSALELHAAYKSTIDTLVELLQIERAINVKDEMDEFVQKERQILGIAADDPKPVPKSLEKPIAEKPIKLNLQQERLVREYDDPDPASNVFVRVSEIENFPSSAEFRGEKKIATPGKPAIIEFSDMAGPQIEIACFRNTVTRKVQVRVEPVFLEGSNKEFDLTFPRLDKLQASTMTK